MKVAHITTTDMSLRYLLLHQLQAIEKAGYEVVGMSAPGVEVPVLTAAGIRHIAIPFARASYITPFADFRAFWQLVKVLREERVTIVHTHTAKPDLYAAIAARVAGVPIVICTLHGFLFHEHMPVNTRRFFVALSKIGARFADVVLSQNDEDVQTAVAEKIVPPAKIKFLGNGIDVDEFDRARVDMAQVARKRRELGLEPEARVIGFVGRMVADKGIRELLSALRQVREHVPNVKLLLIGPFDKAKRDVTSPTITADYGVADISIFTGERHDLPELYALMDVLAFPSYREGLPRVPMEASAMGVPIVATRVRGNRTAIQEGQNGMLVPLGDVDALASALVEVLNDRECARQMGKAGARIARERFDERDVFARVLEEYGVWLKKKGFSPHPLPPLPVGAGKS